ncbi:hypothetical protein EBR57_08420, partial [bacterium]|nr:hypothetical protein [bacterium]
SAALTTFGDLNGSSVSGVGMSIDGSGLGLSSNGILTGIYVSATTNARVNSLITDGGYVGVGVVNPSVALEVGGTLAGGSVVLGTLKEWTVVNVTANQVTVSGDAVMDVVENLSGTTSIETAVISGDMINNIPGNRVYPVMTATDMAIVVGTFNMVAFPTVNADMVLGKGSTQNVMVVSGSMIANGVTIQGGTVTVNTFGVNGQLNLTGGVSTNRRAISSESFAAKSMILTATTTPVTTPTEDSYLYIDSASGNELIYVNRVANATANLSLAVSASANRVGYFNDVKQLSSGSYMDVVTVNEVGILRVGTEGVTVRTDGTSIMKMKGDVPTESSSDDTIYAIGMSVGARSVVGSTTMNAASVRLGNVGDQLGANDVAVGLSVEFGSGATSSVLSRSGVVVSSNFRAATFMAGRQTSGNVVINTSGDAGMRASADLHIATVVTTNGHADFVVQSTVNGTMRDLIIVSNNGNVGVGSSVNVGIGRLAINGIASGIDALGVYNSAGAVMVVGDNGGVGLGTSAGSAFGLVVNGQGKGTLVKATGGLVPKTMSISSGNGGLVVSSAGNVGIGTTSPVAQLEISRAFLRPENLTSAYTMETVSFNTSASVVSRNITGVEFVATSAALTT